MTEIKIQQAADLYAEKEKDLHIFTCKGRAFYINHPEFDIEEIAHASAMQCRYTGHVSDFYSVAEHGLVVSRMMREIEYCKAGGGTPFEGLMHDAHEAYVSDIAAPWKVVIPDYRAVEEKLERALRVWAELPPKISPGVKRADWLALLVEAIQMLPAGTTDGWLTPDDYVKPLAHELVNSGRWNVRNLSPKLGKLLFLEEYKRLSAQRSPVI